MNWEEAEHTLEPHELAGEIYDSMDGPSEEEAYLQGKNYLNSMAVTKRRNPIRRIQNNPTTCRNSVPWEGRKTSDRQGYRFDARCSKPPQINL